MRRLCSGKQGHKFGAKATPTVGIDIGTSGDVHTNDTKKINCQLEDGSPESPKNRGRIRQSGDAPSERRRKEAPKKLAW